ncbi:hypothetical protein COU88_05410 [Candidatus Roizmanbacteria bacterium CG10_big_fil_rev_8_21_14_0_10_39_6]|uniref:SHS2 domain-containing protein n=1 Tax=Candidatus Roizmanbacteria bacterium CG10_big_fil_rev_8_21_14_0_10_39_6 TaxID=1974853 RepID=A0A2M8KR07_9BACT|nr:MAG: hypothetical protein COU88_05410 [Candidatus Roizmanbacteria bacterium CG10_big_fil_rev_8_21_14_0_10_39_6]
MSKVLGVSIYENNIVFVRLSNDTKPYMIDKIVHFDNKIPHFFEQITKAKSKETTQAVNIIRDTLKKEGMSELEAHIVLPDHTSSTQILSLPLITEKEIVSAIELQADEFIPYPIEKATFDYQVLSVDKEKNSMSVLVAVMLKELVNSIEGFILDIGLYPLSVEPVTTSFYRLLFGKYMKEKENIVLFLNIDNRSTQASIINLSQQLLLMTYSFSIGNDFFLRGIQSYQNIGDKESSDQFMKIAENPKIQPITSSLFAEFSKEIRKIFLSSTEKIGTTPKHIIIYSQYLNAFQWLFTNDSASILPQTTTIDIEDMKKSGVIKLAPAIKSEELLLYFPALTTCLQ